jgi:hypothetical protein
MLMVSNPLQSMKNKILFINSAVYLSVCLSVRPGAETEVLKSKSKIEVLKLRCIAFVDGPSLMLPKISKL